MLDIKFNLTNVKVFDIIVLAKTTRSALRGPAGFLLKHG